MLSTSQLRVAWSPACKLRPSYRFTFWNGVPVTVDGRLKDALTELDQILNRWGYRPKSGQTWGYNCRRITGGTGYSLHAYGISVDINSLANPYGKRLITDMPRQMVEGILALRTNNGKQVWGWGGNYRTNKDAMHFEIVCTPADLATGIRGSSVPVRPVSEQPIPTNGTKQEEGMALVLWSAEGSNETWSLIEGRPCKIRQGRDLDRLMEKYKDSGLKTVDLGPKMSPEFHADMMKGAQ